MNRTEKPHNQHDQDPGPWKPSEGQVLVMFAAALMLLIGMVAVAIDTGFLMAERRQVQNAADAGALAAAKAKLDYLAQPANQQARQVEAGRAFGARNADVSEDNVEVDTSPEGYGNEYVEVTVSKDVDMFFLRALYDGEWGTSASAIAGIEPVQLPYALVALRECDAPGVTGIGAGGSIRIDVNEGSIMSNCRITRSGDSSFVLADGAIDAAGTINPGTNWRADQGFREGRPPLSDPIVDQGIVPPSQTAAQALRNVTTQSQLHAAVSGSITHQNNAVRCSANCVMQPGYYGGNLHLDVRNSGRLQLQPGVYYFGDNFRFEQQGGGLVSGTGVMVYVTDNAYWEPHNARIDIAAPNESPYPGGLDGMVLWIANGSTFNLQAGSGTSFTGVIYAPRSRMTLQGSPSAQTVDLRVQVIVGALELSGGGTFNILYEEFVLFDVPGIFLVR